MELKKLRSQACPLHDPPPRPVGNFIFIEYILLKQDYPNYLSSKAQNLYPLWSMCSGEAEA